LFFYLGRGGDTSRAGKYSDDHHSGSYDSGYSQSVAPRARKEETVEEEVEEVQIKAPSKVGGKLKVAIKKDTKKSEVTAKAKAPEVDLFSFDAEPTPPAQTTAVPTSTTTFDPFGAAPTSATTTSFDPFGSNAPVAPTQATSFDPFGSSPPVPSAVPQAAFDPFSAGQFQTPAPAIPIMQQQQSQFQPVVSMQQQFQQPVMGMQPQQFQSFQQPMAPMQQQQTQQPQFQQPLMGMQQQQQQQFQSPGARIALTQPTMEAPVSVQSAEFGDFESAPGTKSGPAVASKWNDLGSLVNLGSITLNEDPKAKSSAAHTQQQSFAGLDGFTKSQQSVVRLSLFIYLDVNSIYISLSIYLFSCYLFRVVR